MLREQFFDESVSTPRVSIVVPTYNRERFLPNALASITAQGFTDWELIVVDDGGADRTPEIVEAYASDVENPVRYHWQENQGPWAARNAGIGLARGSMLAFLDSDDVWESNHLAQCVEALESNDDVDWVYGSFRRLRYVDGKVIHPDVFYPDGRPAEFLSLRNFRRGDLRVIDDSRAVACAVSGGLIVGVKVSLVKRSVFSQLEFPPFRVGEDQALVIRALAKGVRFGYFCESHGIAYIHDEHISEVGGNHSLERSIEGMTELVRAFESLGDLSLARTERRALKRRIANESFWNIGYVCARGGRQNEAIRFLNKGLSLDPINMRFWKTYVLARLRLWLSARSRRASGGNG